MGSLCIIPIHTDNVIDISILIDKVYGVLMFVLDKPQPKLKPKPDTKVIESPTEEMIINWLQRVRKETEVNEDSVNNTKSSSTNEKENSCDQSVKERSYETSWEN